MNVRRLDRGSLRIESSGWFADLYQETRGLWLHPDGGTRGAIVPAYRLDLDGGMVQVFPRDGTGYRSVVFRSLPEEVQDLLEGCRCAAEDFLAKEGQA